jgi:hypothetical protein
MMMTVTRTTDFNLKKQVCYATTWGKPCGNEIVWQWNILCVLEKISPFYTCRLEGIFMPILCVYIFDINMKTECDSLMYVWREQNTQEVMWWNSDLLGTSFFGLNCHKSWQLCAHPWTHTCTGLNRYINLHNDREKLFPDTIYSCVLCDMDFNQESQKQDKYSLCHRLLIWYQLWDLVVLLKLSGDTHKLQSIKRDICPQNGTFSKK